MVFTPPICIMHPDKTHHSGPVLDDEVHHINIFKSGPDKIIIHAIRLSRARVLRGEYCHSRSPDQTIQPIISSTTPVHSGHIVISPSISHPNHATKPSSIRSILTPVHFPHYPTFPDMYHPHLPTCPHLTHYRFSYSMSFYSITPHSIASLLLRSCFHSVVSLSSSTLHYSEITPVLHMTSLTLLPHVLQPLRFTGLLTLTNHSI